MKRKSLFPERGQTSVEYLLIMAVSVGLGLAFFKKFQGYLLDNPDSYFKNQIRSFERYFDPQLNYKKFRLRR